MGEHDQPIAGIVPWPVSLAEELPRPGWVLGFAAGALIALVLWVTGAYNPASTPPYWASREQVISMAIAYPALLGYLTGMMTFAHLRSRRRLEQLEPLLTSAAAAIANRLTRVTPRALWATTGVGILIGMMNVDYTTVLGLREGTTPTSTDFGLAAASMIIWIVVARFTYLLVHNARLFSRLGAHHTHIDLYRPLTRRPFAQTGMLYLLLVMGALAITPLQALDAELRIENYAWAFAIGIPAAVALPLITMKGIRSATLAAKRDELDRLEEDIERASRALDTDSLQRLNALIQRRDYIGDQHGWPMDVRTLSRAAFYVVIPPLAWVGAALVEVAIETLINRA